VAGGAVAIDRVDVALVEEGEGLAILLGPGNERPLIIIVPRWAGR
jgi:hypothetical protein